METSKGYFPPNFHRSNQGVLPLSLFQQSQNTVHNLKYIDSRRHAKREKVLNTCCCLDMEHALVLHFVLQLQLTFRAFKRSRQPGSGGFLRQQNFMDQGIKRAELFFFIQIINLLTAIFQWHECRHNMALSQSAYSRTGISRSCFARLQVGRA